MGYSSITLFTHSATLLTMIDATLEGELQDNLSRLWICERPPYFVCDLCIHYDDPNPAQITAEDGDSVDAFYGGIVQPHNLIGPLSEALSAKVFMTNNKSDDAYSFGDALTMGELSYTHFLALKDALSKGDPETDYNALFIQFKEGLKISFAEKLQNENGTPIESLVNHAICDIITSLKAIDVSYSITLDPFLPEPQLVSTQSSSCSEDRAI